MNSSFPRLSVVVPAAGKSTRMQAGEDKLLMLLDGVPLLSYALHVFEKSPLVSEVILVAPMEKKGLYQQQVVQRFGLKKVAKIVAGGARRQDSVHNGFSAIAKSSEIVMVHDGARPFVTEGMIQASVESASRFGACVVGVPAKATLKESDEEGFVVRTPPRERMWEIQTPQTFRVEVFEEAYQNAVARGIEATDDSMLAEAAGKSVKIIPGSYENIKVTTPDDLLLAEMILRKQKEGAHARRSRV